LQKLQALGTVPVDLSRKAGWTVEECDTFIARNGFEVDAVDPDLDLSGARHVCVASCDCGTEIIFGEDKKGLPLGIVPEYCHRCRDGLSPEDLPNCGCCGGPGVLRPGALCSDCRSHLDYQTAKDD
jgi:hypothetical protein